MYKNKDKQREANRIASQRRRDKGMTQAGYDAKGMTHSIAECMQRARLGQSWREGDPVWPYTRHLNPMEHLAWCRKYRPSWLTVSKPGDADYNWEQSAAPEGTGLQALANSALAPRTQHE